MRGVAASVLAFAMVGLAAGSASARPPVRCDGTYQTTGIPRSGSIGPKGSSETWTAWVPTTDAAGNAAWQYTYVTTTYFGPLGAVITRRTVETCTAD